MDQQVSKKLISVVTPCYNEEENIREIIEAIEKELKKFPQYDYEIIAIDNKSQDNTRKILREIASQNPKVKVIFNTRNFGHIRSPVHGLLQAQGDAVILIASDFQDPPTLIPQMIAKWEEGFRIVKCVRTNTEETFLMASIRKFFYGFINRLSEIRLTKNYTGFGLYDKKVIEILRKIDDPYPYFRGLISDIGFDFAVVEFFQPVRKRGITKNNFYTLYDMAMLGIINHSKIPLRLATFLGGVLAILNMLIGLVYLVLKLIFWNAFPAGTAPLLIGMFFLSSVQLFFLGVIGEYIGCIFTQVQKRPMVVEEERLNF